MSMKKEAADLAVLLQPKAIQRALLRNRQFLKDASLNYQGYADIGTIRYDELVRAMSECKASQAADISTEDGTRFSLTIGESGPCLSPKDAERSQIVYLASELQLLSPSPSARLSEFDRRSSACLPGILPKFWREKLTERILTEDEFSQLSAEMAISPGMVHKRIASKWERGEVTVADLFPDDRGYYERLSGVDPDNFDESKLPEFLKNHHKSLIEHDLKSGLRCAAASCLRNDLNLAWLSDQIEPKNLADLSEALLGPFSAFGLFDLASRLISIDEVFGPIALSYFERAILTNEMNILRDRVFTALIRVGLANLATTMGVAHTPPMWRTLCCFIHCDYIAEIILGGALNIDEFEKFCEDATNSFEYSVAELMALREEPMWRWIQFKPDSLKAELLGRALFSIDGASGVPEAIRASLDQEKNTLGERYSVISVFFPGPLEGHLRRGNPSALGPRQNSTDFVEGFEKTLNKLRANPFDDEWGRLEFLAHGFHYSDEYRIALRELVNGQRTLPDGDEGIVGLARMLSATAFIAATHSDELMAVAVADSCQRFFKEITDRFGIQSVVRAILLSAASIEAAEKWNAWVGETLTRMAFKADRSVCLELARCVSAIRDFLRPEHSRLSRAYYAALAGI